MKKSKISLVETKSIRVMLLFVIIQFLIVILFVLLVRGSRQIDMNDTKQIDITVDDIYIIRVAGEDQLVVVADSTEYLFEGRATFEDHSVHALYNSISKGDSLSLIYYESDRILFKNANVVVDARTETEIYRDFEEYNRGMQGVPIFVVILFSIIELFFIGIVFVYVWFNYGAQRFYTLRSWSNNRK